MVPALGIEPSPAGPQPTVLKPATPLRAKSLGLYYMKLIRLSILFYVESLEFHLEHSDLLLLAIEILL